MTPPVELLAPAGDPESGYAALHYGADALYLGLPRFSARAEAVNFTTGDLSEIVAYAHALTPRRRIFVTVNTVILQNELAEAVDLLMALADLEVDAVIVQDLGIARIIRQHIPELAMHASTQMAVHNLAGAQALKDLGFARVTLARELTLKEVRDITARCGIETETFIHGALCYSYSGLCLFSSMMRGRSGNRGRCTYPCRDFCRVEARLKPGFPFSMKDLSLGGHVKDLREAGVASLKIEGRKKSPLYVATVVNYYRRMLDGHLSSGERKELESQMKTVFSRPWTPLFIDSAKQHDVVDRDVVGHRGVEIGKVETVYRPGRGDDTVRFKSARAIERHDGLQIDIPGAEKPYGFPVDDLRILAEGGRAKSAFEAPAGATVEVRLPPEHPQIPIGATLYCSSSQVVKRSYPYDRPKPAEFRVRRRMDVEVEIKPDSLRARGIVRARNAQETDVTAEATVAGTFAPAKDPTKTEAAVLSSFEKLGDTRLEPGRMVSRNPDKLFGPVSMLNDLRRKLAAELQAALDQALARRTKDIQGKLAVPGDPATTADDHFAWSIKVDKLAHLAMLEADDWRDVGEIVVDISRDDGATIEAGLEALAEKVGKDRIRLALPEVTRADEEQELRRRISVLRKAGWGKWQASNVSAWTFLALSAPRLRDASNGVAPVAQVDLTVDWSVYTLNGEAARAILDRGARGFTLSPEDTRENMQKLLSEFGDKATVIVYQDTPLFLSASCAHASLAGKCQGGGACREEHLLLKMAGGETVVAIQDNCRTIVVNEVPFCLADRLVELRKMGARNLRVDFIWQTYTPEEVRDLWRQIRSGRTPPPGHTANFTLGLV